MNQLGIQIIPILQKHGITRASLVGSYARGEATAHSDIDLVVEPPQKMSLMGLVRVERELEEHLKLPVDLLTYNSLHPYIRQYILKDEQVLYG